MTDNAKPGFFSKQKPDNSYKKIPKPKSAFTSDNTDLLENIHPEEDVLKINNKSLGIPAIVWGQVQIVGVNKYLTKLELFQ